MRMTLYHFNNSTCSEKVRMVLNEKGIADWESKELDVFRGDQFDPAYLRLNPKAVVPTLVDENGVLIESTIIAEYLDDVFPDPPLRPDSPLALAQMRLYSKACDEGLHQATGVMSFSAMFVDRLRRLSPDRLKSHLDRIIDLDRRDRQFAILEHGVEAPHVYRGTVAFEKIFQKIDRVLSDGREWLLGSRFTLAEINLAPYLARMEYLHLLDVWTRERPQVVAWFRRIQARASYEREIRDWIRPDEWSEMREAGIRIKPRIEAFRDTYLQNDFGAQIY